jgi:Na+/glutamate symporter
VQSPLEQSFWNALAILLPVVVGAGAALAAGWRRHTVGSVASVLAILGAHFGARLAYGVETPDYELRATFVILLASAVLGLIGGHLAGYVVPHSKRMQRARDG